jgi:hypothetical protein
VRWPPQSLSETPWRRVLPDLESLLERLIQHQVEFVVIGGFAAVAHGVTLLTQDVDVCCRLGADNLLRIQSALADLHPVHRMPPQRPALMLTPTTAAEFRNRYLETDWGQLDCLLSISALIRAKDAMGRPRDCEAIVQLRAIRERTSGGE